jgi:hypothetical protein
MRASSPADLGRASRRAVNIAALAGVGDECSGRGKRKSLIHKLRIDLSGHAYFIAT